MDAHSVPIRVFERLLPFGCCVSHTRGSGAHAGGLVAGGRRNARKLVMFDPVSPTGFSLQARAPASFVERKPSIWTREDAAKPWRELFHFVSRASQHQSRAQTAFFSRRRMLRGEAGGGCCVSCRGRFARPEKMVAKDTDRLLPTTPTVSSTTKRPVRGETARCISRGKR